MNLYALQLFVFSFALTATTDSTFQSKMDSTRLSNLLDFRSHRLGDVSVGGSHGGRPAVVLLTTDGTALACGFNDRLGPLPYAETHVTTSYLLVLVDSLILKAEALYRRRDIHKILFEEHGIQELAYHKSFLDDSISQARLAMQMEVLLHEEENRRNAGICDDVSYAWATTKIDEACRLVKKRCLASAEDRCVLDKHLDAARAWVLEHRGILERQGGLRQRKSTLLLLNKKCSDFELLLRDLDQSFDAKNYPFFDVQSYVAAGLEDAIKLWRLR